MQHAGDTFHLLDLASQAEAVQSLLAGRTPEEKLAWFESHGKLRPAGIAPGNTGQAWVFESQAGMRCVFFIAGDALVFVGDNSTWSVPPREKRLQNPPVPRTGAAGIVSSVVRMLLGRGPGR